MFRTKSQKEKISWRSSSHEGSNLSSSLLPMLLTVAPRRSKTRIPFLPFSFIYIFIYTSSFKKTPNINAMKEPPLN
jgi:hypothetical protein